MNNARKLLTVLGTLVGITIAAIVLVILWYRLKAVYKRRQKKKKIVEQQKQFSSPANSHHHHSTAPRYASSDMLSSIHSGQFIGNKGQSQALIASSTPSATVYKNVDAAATAAAAGNESVQSLAGEDNQRQQASSTTEIEATTEC